MINKKNREAHKWLSVMGIVLGVVLSIQAKEKRPIKREVVDISVRGQAWEMRQAASTSAEPWVNEGPTGVGRFSAVAVHPTNDDIVYYGAASGGVLKSTDGGDTWVNLWSDMKSQSIGDIAIAPSDGNIVWVGGGESFGGGGSLTYPGEGVVKSIDGGATWQHMGLDSSYHIGRIAIHPTNPNIVYVAAMGSLWEKGGSQRGLFKTIDGGVNWTKILGSGAGGIPAGDDTTGAMEIKIHPTNPNVVLVSFWTAQRKPFARTWGGPSCRIWRTEDGGDSWSVLGSANGLPTTDIGKAQFDVSLINPNIWYMVYLTSLSTFKAVYRSTDGGVNWSPVSGNNSIPGASMYSYYGYSFGLIKVNPHNASEVILFGISSYRTTNGGGTWTRTFLSTHADDRAFAWSYQDPNKVYLGDDGGIRVGTNGPNGTLPEKATGSNGVPFSQLYSIDIAPDNANYRYAGFQDNGTMMTSTGSNSNWTSILGGDGFSPTVDKGEPTNVVACWQFFGCQHSSTRGTNMAAMSGNSGRGAWETPVAIDPANGMKYLAGQFAFRSPRGSRNMSRIGPDLSNGDHSFGAYQYGVASAADVHNDVYYVGTDDGNIWYVPNASTGNPAFTKIRNGASGGPGTGDRSYNGWIKHIYINRATNGSEFYTAINWYRWGTSAWKPSIWKVTNFGTNWNTDATDISGDLPAHITTNKVIIDNHPSRDGWLYVATDYGVFYSVNDGVNWSWLGDKSLPLIPVNDLELHEATQTLYIGTYGLGLWSIDLSQVTPIGDKVTYAGNQMLNNFPNPVKNSTKIQFRIKDRQKVNLSIYDYSGKVVKSFLDKTVEANQLQTITWNRQADNGSKVPAGNYILRIFGDKVTMAKQVVVK